MAYLFSKTASIDFFQYKIQNIVNQINQKTENELLNVSLEQFAEYMTSLHELNFPKIVEAEITVSSYEMDVPASQFPPQFSFVDYSKSFKKNVIVFHLPFIGDITYLHVSPGSFSTSGTPNVEISNNEIRFEYLDFYGDNEKIKKEFNADLDRLMRAYNFLKDEFETYNYNLKNNILNALTTRRNELLKKNNFLSSFGIPLKAGHNTSKTFAVPSPVLREKISISKPTSNIKGFTPEPTLDYNNYYKILKIIDDVGRNFERMPSIYKGKEEEDLRDHILMVLDPNFEYGSASGETFNKSGKTDILLRYESSVVFVAECKFWGGEKGFYKTIDQLLKYLTWRDSKTSIIIFVRNKEISLVLQKIDEITPMHKCYINTKGKKAENWSEHIFHLPDDSNKEVVLSILVFHLPDK